MKKLVLTLCVALLVMSIVPTTGVAQTTETERGGVPAFFIGCCWGLREGTMWNGGSDMHWREWVRIIPYVGIVFAIWDGVECYQGITAQEWAAANGANWF